MSAFVGEISSAVITFIFNMLILGLTGSTGVAAYGVVANMSLVGMAIMNGMSQGAQPLISESFGKGAADDVKKLLSWALKSVVAVEIILVALVWIFTDPFIAVFNSENNRLLLECTYRSSVIFPGIFVCRSEYHACCIFFCNGKCASGNHWFIAARCSCYLSMCDCTFHDLGNEWRVAVFPDIRNYHLCGSSDSWKK